MKGKNTTEYFQARYSSTCVRCTRKIVVGEEVQYLAGELKHRDCKDQGQLYYKQERRKRSSSFIMRGETACSTCFELIREGEKARYNPEGLLVHAVHHSKEKKVEICTKCWLVKPCQCDT